MTFHSILLDKNGIQKETTHPPAYFSDLNLDQVIDAVTAYKQTYNLKPFFYTPLRDAETVRYRQEVMQDMEDPALMAYINAFAEDMDVARRRLARVEKLYSDPHKKGWFLESALVYCDAVTDLARNLSRADLKSRGLLAFREYATNYTRSHEFESLKREARTVKEKLSGIRYCVIIQHEKLSVRKCEGETDYSVEVESAFEKFRQGAPKNYLAKLPEKTEMNHIEAKILEFVARLYPEQFAALDQFCSEHAQYMDETICTFDREIQFYVAYLDFVTDIKRKGLTFSYPQVSATHREVFARESFDLALANALLHSEAPVICNDFFLQEPERIIVVTGPNQGGKTTFARMFGQVHYFASLGCPVPGKEAQLLLFDQIFTHFEQEEDIRNLRGKLQDDLMRIHAILAHATSDSILILNEIFASTTLEDAVFLSKQIMTRLVALDALCVWVTFIDELSHLNEKTVSMVSAVEPQNPAERTFKIVRKPADGLAYALSLVEKRGLTYEQIKERIQP